MMIFPGDFVSQVVSRVPASPGDLELDALFEDHWVSWLAIDEMFALDAEVQQTEMRSRLTYPCRC